MAGVGASRAGQPKRIGRRPPSSRGDGGGWQGTGGVRKKQMDRRSRKRIEVRYGPGGPQFIGYSRNVSRTGIMVVAIRVFAPGTALDLEVKLPAGTFRLKGTVVWAREGPVSWLATGRVGMGISFLDPPQEFLDTIRAGGAGSESVPPGEGPR